MRKIVIVFIAMLLVVYAKSQIYMGKTFEIVIFSPGTNEDIYAINKNTKSVLNIATKEIALKIPIRGFEFKSLTTEEYFNEKYMESGKYPYVTFTGKINETIDYSKDSLYNITVTGKLTMRGVEKNRTLQGIVIIKKGGAISFESNFFMALKDYNSSTPRTLTKNFADVVGIFVKGTLTESKIEYIQSAKKISLNTPHSLSRRQ